MAALMAARGAHGSGHRSGSHTSNTSNLPRLLVRAEEVPSVLGCSQDHFHRHIKAHVPVVRSGALRLYRVEDLAAWAEENAGPLLEGER